MHIIIVRKNCAMIVLGPRYGENIVKCDQRQHCIKVWYLGTNLYRKKCAQWTSSSLVTQCPISHPSVYELSYVEAMVWTVNNKTGTNMYWHLWFPHLCKRSIHTLCAIGTKKLFLGVFWVFLLASNAILDSHMRDVFEP